MNIQSDSGGAMSLRMSPDLHRKVAIAAAERGVSVNRWITERLTTG